MINNVKKIEFNNKTKATQSILIGIPSSPGLVHGKAVVLEPESIILPDEKIETKNIHEELDRLETAIRDLIQEFVHALSKVKDDAKNVASVLESDLMILTDETFLKKIRNKIEECFSAENAIVQEFDHQIHFLLKSNDHILRERANELDHIKERLISVLRNRCIFYGSGKNSIVIAQSLTPTDIVNFKEAGALGFITEVGGITSHSSILARSYEIPEVIGIKEATSIIKDNDKIILDGYTGSITVNPTKKSVSAYVAKKQKEQEHKKQLGELAKLKAVTTDGKQIRLMANINVSEDIETALIYGAEGVGLVRSEQLIISKNSIPSEEEQFNWFKSLADSIFPEFVTIRAFDIGSDKYSEGMPKHEQNPALGFRGIRFLLHRVDIFKEQIRAILRVSKNKNIRLMLPLITCYNEIEKTKKIIEECKKELSKENIPFDNNLPLGIMIETPAAAILSEKIAPFIDFFSIGTNDLTQYTLAVDRTNEYVSSIYDSFHPTVLSLIKLTSDAANKHNIPVSVCGELAGHAAATSLLIGLGITELSVSPSMLLELKKRVRETSYQDSKKLADEILKIANCEDVRQKLSFTNE
jgi:phosphotransferase system enzyme I (PtsI)